jgi:hypothetical protein
LVVVSANVCCAIIPQSLESTSPTQAIPACGSTIDLTIKGDTQSISREIIVKWVNRAATAVCTYYGKYPVAHTSLNVQVHGGPGVHHGVTYPAENGGRIRISVGPGTSQAQLDDDWMLTHEMIHQAFPYMAESHHWIEEGISVYVEPIARVQAGQMSATQMWHDVVRDMPQGEPEFGDEGLDRTHTWGRTYWGGAMFCLLADVRIREQTRNRKGLQDALRGILDAGGNIDQDWPIERAFEAGDKATGTTVLIDLYRQMRDSDMPTDLASLWQQLGIEKKADGSVAFSPHAKLSSVREAITSPPKPETRRASFESPSNK